MKNLELEILRHSTAHLMASAVQKLFPNTKFGIGPAIEDGFYYDFDMEKRLEPEDLELIEKEMQKIAEEDLVFEKIEKTRNEAIEFFTKKNQPYKVEIIKDLPSEIQEVSFFRNGDFVDLCKGPHLERTSEIKYFKLLNLAGAYWRGNEKNPMLQRIYGTAFYTKEALDEYLKVLDEARSRDHRTLGRELDLFSVTDEIGGGLVLWHPNGARVRNVLENFWRDEHFRNGYEILYTPHIGKSTLWETSGHLGFYNENMYSPMQVDDQDYIIKPMNCPFHILVYKNSHHSYRDLPLRWAELGTVYRYERSGVLHGLMRVRGFTQDDAHIFCAQEQMEDEIIRVLKFCLKMLKDFGFSEYKIYVSTRPEKKFVGKLEEWERAEKALMRAIELANLEYEIDEGGGAFYGPKIDIKIKDALKREWQCSTIQFDFNLPERFDMTYIGADGGKHRPYMIHRALLGSIERFFGILVEHYKGAFPVWLMHEQVRILTITEKQNEYAKNIFERLTEAGIRASINSSNEKLGYKVREAQVQKIPFMLIIGEKEQENNTISVRNRINKTLELSDLGKFIDFVLDKVQNKSLTVE